MAVANKILAIDIGGCNLKIAELSFAPNGAITLERFAFRSLDRTDESGEILDPVLAFVKAYNELLAENNFTAKEVRLSLSAKLSFQRLSKLPPAVGSRSAINKIVEYEARQNVPYAISDVEWSYQLIRHEWQETRDETQEDGSIEQVVENNEEFEAMFVAVKTDQMTAYTDVIQASGKKIISVEIAPIALFNVAMATQIKPDECTLMLNIGGSGTSLMIADHNRAFIRNIPIAGDAITSQIAKEFNISFEEAEEMKKRHGFVALGGAYEEPDSELAATISKIVRNLMTRLHGEVSRSINVWRAQHGGSAPVRLLLSGGGSTMLYMTDFFQEKLHIPVEYLNTFSAVNLGAELNKDLLQEVAPMVQELFGLALHNVGDCPINIVLLPKAIRQQYDFNRRKPYFYGSAAVLLVCLFIFNIGLKRLSIFEQHRYDRVAEEVAKTNKKAKEIQGLMSKLNAEKGEFEEYAALFALRNAYTNVLQELQSMVPDMMWFVKIEPTDEIPPEKPKNNLMTANKDSGYNSGYDSNSNQGNNAKPTERDIREVRYLVLHGYTIAVSAPVKLQNAGNTGKPQMVRRTRILEEEFLNRLKNSKYFTTEWTMRDNRTEGNLTRFIIILKLKEPIRK